jgi:hypothetical protein
MVSKKASGGPSARATVRPKAIPSPPATLERGDDVQWWPEGFAVPAVCVSTDDLGKLADLVLPAEELAAKLKTVACAERQVFEKRLADKRRVFFSAIRHLVDHFARYPATGSASAIPPRKVANKLCEIEKIARKLHDVLRKMDFRPGQLNSVEKMAGRWLNAEAPGIVMANYLGKHDRQEEDPSGIIEVLAILAKRARSRIESDIEVQRTTQRSGAAADNPRAGVGGRPRGTPGNRGLDWFIHQLLQTCDIYAQGERFPKDNPDWLLKLKPGQELPHRSLTISKNAAAVEFLPMSGKTSKFAIKNARTDGWHGSLLDALKLLRSYLPGLIPDEPSGDTISRIYDRYRKGWGRRYRVFQGADQGKSLAG